MESLIREKIHQIESKLIFLENMTSSDENLVMFLRDMGTRVIRLRTFDFDRRVDLEKTNKMFENLYSDLIKGDDESYSNPDYMMEHFGSEFGQLLSCLYYETSKLFKYYILGEDELCCVIMDMYLAIVQLTLDDQASYKKIYHVYKKYKYILIDVEIVFECSFNYDYLSNRYYEIAQKVVKDKQAMSLYGEYISEYEIAMYDKMNDLSDQVLDDMARAFVQAYILGFKVDNKDINKRSIVRLIGSIGQERLLIRTAEIFEEKGLKTIISDMMVTPINRQFDYDFKYNEALILDQAFVNFKLETLEASLKRYGQYVKEISGDAIIERFGEEPFEPMRRSGRLKLSDQQLDIDMVYQSEKKQMVDNYIPEEDTSYCLMALPSAEIGSDFSEILDNIIDINLLKNEDYEPIQQLMIDELDQGSHVLLKGKGRNQTDIKIALPELKNPEKESNFLNCGSDVNIPIGEVFTTPKLKGTEGILHIGQVYLDEIMYKDLWLEFKDGYVKDYTCSNFPDEKDNKAMIEDNLLKPHKTLPMGEFAIGTNTKAYMMAKKFGIMEKLPILIAEKLGPHMAIGDTCYSWREDARVYSLHTGKEIVAKDNEHSLARHHDLQAAYTNQHVDITIPYHELDYIRVVRKEGKIVSIIEDSRFVLQGTEFLNKAFDVEGDFHD